MAYAFKLTDIEGDYVEFNISPDIGAPIAPGERITITGQYRYSGLKTYGLRAVIGLNKNDYDFLMRPLVIADWKSTAVNSGRVCAFTLSGVIPAEATSLDTSGARLFNPYLSFEIYTDDSYTATAGVRISESCRLALLKNRLAPVISGVQWGDATAAQSLFGNLVQSYSRPTISISETLDALDPSVAIVSRKLMLNGVEHDLASPAQTFAALDVSGSVPWALTITDNKGKSESTSGVLTVLAWKKPSIDFFDVKRYTANVDDIGETVYVESDDGENVWISLSADVSPVSGLNAWSAVLSINDGVKVEQKEILSGEDGSEISISQDTKIYDAPVSASRNYSFTITITDWFTEALKAPVQIVADVPSADSRFNVEENGVAVGMYSTGEPQNKRFEVAKEYTSHFYGGISGVNIFHEGEEKTGGKWIDGKDIYRFVWVGTTKADGGAEDVCTIPSAFETMIRATCMCRREDNSWAPLPYAHYNSSSWMGTFWIGNPSTAPVVQVQLGSSYNGTKGLVFIFEYTRLREENPENPGWVQAATRPLKAMTSNNSQGCVASASSQYSSEYAV